MKNLIDKIKEKWYLTTELARLAIVWVGIITVSIILTIIAN